MKFFVIAAVVGSITSCSGGSSVSSPAPTAPTPAVANATVDGSYNVTLTASASCAGNLPADTRVLNYVANVVQHSGVLQLQLLSHVIWNTVTVNATVSGQTVNFSTFSFSEITTANGIALSSTGTANVAADGSIAGTLSGTYQTPSGATCNATNHQIQMTKR